MSDVPVYAVVNLHVTDATTYRQYEKGFFPLLKKYGGEFITYDDQAVTLEGIAPRTGRMIIWKFPSEALPRHRDSRDPQAGNARRSEDAGLHAVAAGQSAGSAQG